MECRTFEHFISEYLEGTLPGDQASAFMAHLSSCERCRGLLEDVRAALELCRGVGEVEPPSDLPERLQLVLQGAAMSCAAFGELISNYFDGVLTATEYHLFEAHARVCSTCHQMVEDVAAVTRLLEGIEPVAVPEGMNERLLQAMRSAHEELTRTWGWRWRRRWRAWRLGWSVVRPPLLLPRWAMAAILCLAMLGVTLLNLSADRKGSLIARLSDRAAGVQAEGGRVLERLEQWRAQVSDILQLLRTGRRSATSGRGRSGDASEPESPPSPAPAKKSAP
jgi:anti-sigma factor RsiW